jgi:hypothetical protein
MKSNLLIMEEDSDLALDGGCATTAAGVFRTLLGDSVPPNARNYRLTPARWERVPVLPHRLEGTIAFDCNGEVS